MANNQDEMASPAALSSGRDRDHNQAGRRVPVLARTKLHTGLSRPDAVRCRAMQVGRRERRCLPAHK
jgi:hypothetical protein